MLSPVLQKNLGSRSLEAFVMQPPACLKCVICLAYVATCEPRRLKYASQPGGSTWGSSQIEDAFRPINLRGFSTFWELVIWPRETGCEHTDYWCSKAEARLCLKLSRFRTKMVDFDMHMECPKSVSTRRVIKALYWIRLYWIFI